MNQERSESFFANGLFIPFHFILKTSKGVFAKSADPGQMRHLQKRNLTGFFYFFCHFLGFEKSGILQIDIYCSCISASYTLIFHSSELSKSFICYKNLFLHVLHVCSLAFVILLANCYVVTLH